jgi:hypothetical protein
MKNRTAGMKALTKGIALLGAVARFLIGIGSAAILLIGVLKKRL